MLLFVTVLDLLILKVGNMIFSDSHYRKALELSPNYSEAHYNLALLYKELGSSLKDINKLRDAEVHFEKSIEYKND